MRALWIEIPSGMSAQRRGTCRGSWEPCGLKWRRPDTSGCPAQSRLVRALWIEIPAAEKEKYKGYCRGSWEPCGLKSRRRCHRRPGYGRGSWEPCGLKWFCWQACPWCSLARLVRALWIEIVSGLKRQRAKTSRLVRALWIEIVCVTQFSCIKRRRGSWEPCGLKLTKAGILDAQR